MLVSNATTASAEAANITDQLSFAQTPATSQPSLFPADLTTEPAPPQIPEPTAQGVPQFSSPLEIAQTITAAEDGTGTVIDQTGNTFDITGGTHAGNNLFHSFEHFGLDAGQIANIVSQTDIDNILGRVVSGDPSVINGLIQVTGGDSNLFLINPAGVIFGSESQVIVPGSFSTTTANGMKIDDYWFNAVGPNDYDKLVGTPNGFAFTSAEPGSIVNAGHLQGESVTLLGGVVVNTGTIETPGGNITIAAVPDESMVRITHEGSLLSLELSVEGHSGINIDSSALTASNLLTLLSGGTTPDNLGIVLEDGVVKIASTNTTIPTNPGTTIISGTLDAANETEGEIGGNIDVLGSQVGLLNAALDASETDGGGIIRIGGDYQGQGLLPTAEHTYINEGSTITADALVSGDGGRVIVWADNTTEFYGDIIARGGSLKGNGGFVEVSGHENLSFHGQVDITATNGLPGTMLLDPRNINIVSDASALNNNQLNDGSIFATDGNTSDFTISASELKSIEGDIQLQADEDIRVEEGLSLNFVPSPIAGSIIFKADADNNNSGDFIMDQSQELIAGSFRFVRDLTISAVNIQTGDISSGGLTLQSSYEGNIETGNIDAEGITRLEADQGDIIIESIDVKVESFYGSSPAEENPSLSISTDGLVRIEGVINPNDELSIGVSSDMSRETVSNPNEILSIRHGGILTEIAETSGGQSLIIEGGDKQFGFVIGPDSSGSPLQSSSSDFPVGISGISGSVVLGGRVVIRTAGGSVLSDSFSTSGILGIERNRIPSQEVIDTRNEFSSSGIFGVPRRNSLPGDLALPRVESIETLGSLQGNSPSEKQDNSNSGLPENDEDNHENNICNTVYSSDILDISSVISEQCQSSQNPNHNINENRTSDNSVRASIDNSDDDRSISRILDPSAEDITTYLLHSERLRIGRQ